MFEFFLTNSVARFTVLALIFAVTMFGAVGVLTNISRRVSVKADLRELGSSGSAITNFERLEVANDSAWMRLADRIEKVGLNLADTKSDALRQKMVAAGFDSPAAPRMFTLIRMILIFLLPLLYVVFIVSREPNPSFFRVYIVGAGLALAGLYVPSLFVTAKADRRREEIVNGFPDCLDLLLVCVEAGLGLEAAMDRVGREMVNSHPLVARLIQTATLQIRAGASREMALRRMAESCGVDEIRNFATLLIQSDKLGTSIATTLRVYATEMREKRRLRAEEKAHRIPVIISIPLVVCMLPTMIGVLMLPGIVRAIRQILPALGG